MTQGADRYSDLPLTDAECDAMQARLAAEPEPLPPRLADGGSLLQEILARGGEPPPFLPGESLSGYFHRVESPLL